MTESEQKEKQTKQTKKLDKINFQCKIHVKFHNFAELCFQQITFKLNLATLLILRACLQGERVTFKQFHR